MTTPPSSEKEWWHVWFPRPHSMVCQHGFCYDLWPFEYSAHFLSSNFTNYPKADEYRDVFDCLGDGIFNVDGDLWRLQRKMFQLWNARQISKSGFIYKTIQRKVVDDLIPFLDCASETGIQVRFLKRCYPIFGFLNCLIWPVKNKL